MGSEESKEESKEGVSLQTFYHYTTPQSAEAIIRTGVIKKSKDKANRRSDNAVYGSGVYLTRVGPSTSRHRIAFNNYDVRSADAVDHAIASGKVNAYIKLDLDPSDLEECYDHLGRNIFLYPDKDLQIKPYMNAHMDFT